MVIDGYQFPHSVIKGGRGEETGKDETRRTTEEHETLQANGTKA